MSYSPIQNPHPVTDGPLATLAGAVIEAAPASDTASSGLNGRLQRIAQRITTLITAFGASADATVASGATGTAMSYWRTIKDSILTLVTQGSSTAPVPIAMADEYETVAAGASDQVLGTVGAVGDRLTGILINPATTSPGQVVVKDGTTTIYTFAGGATSVSDLSTRIVPFGLKSLNGGWKITTGTNVSVIGIGDFT